MGAFLGVTVPLIEIALVRNSRQAFALRWIPSEGSTLDMSDTEIVLEIDARPPVFKIAVTAEDSDVEGAWRSTWIIDETEADWNFKLVNGRIVSNTASDRVVLLHARIEVQE